MSVIFLISHKLNNYQKHNLFGANKLLKALCKRVYTIGIAFADKNVTQSSCIETKSHKGVCVIKP